MRRADRILVSGVRIGRLFLLFSLPLLIALRYRPALSEAESCTEKSNFLPQVIAAPSIEGTPPLWNRRGFSKYLSAAAERETESVFFVFRFTAAPFNCGHVLLQSKCTAQPVEDLRVSAVPRTGLPLSPGGVSKGEGRCRPFVPRGGMGDGGSHRYGITILGPYGPPIVPFPRNRDA